MPRNHVETGKRIEKFKTIHVFDLDGVLVDTAHRYRNKPDGTIDLVYWLENRTAEKIAQDTLLPHAENYFKSNADPEIYTIICTSRIYNILDIEFIVGYLGAPNKLIMRPENELGGDAVLKLRQLQRIFNLRQFKNLPAFLWEDNPKNISTLQHMFTSCFFVPSHITKGIKI